MELLSHIWQTILEHIPEETMPAFDNNLKDTGTPTPSKLDAMEVHVSDQHGPKERMSALIGEMSGG